MITNLRSCFCVALLAISFATHAFAQQSGSTSLLDLVKKSKTTVFLGDSITASGQYIGMFEAWLLTQGWETKPKFIDVGLPSETVSGLSEDGHAGGQFPRPDLAERLDRVLATTKPDLVFACYGMNCGIYLPLDEKRFEAYRNGFQQLKKKVEATGAQFIVITPPFYDDLRKPLEGFSYNGVLDQYSKWLVSQREQGWRVIDLHTAMTNEILERRKSDPAFTVQPDAVHPNDAGHWCMAKHFIQGLGGKLSSEASPQVMLKASGLPPEVLALTQKRVDVLRNAYVAAAGHKRPGVAKGLPIDEAEAKAAEITAEIQKLVAKK